MNDGHPKKAARDLFEQHGPHEAWQHSTREAIGAHLKRDTDNATYWAAVQQELNAIAPRPGAGDLDIYRSARMLLADRDAQEAWRHAMQQSVQAGSDLLKQGYWLRVADAINALTSGQGREDV